MPFRVCGRGFFGNTRPAAGLGPDLLVFENILRMKYNNFPEVTHTLPYGYTSMKRKRAAGFHAGNAMAISVRG